MRFFILVEGIITKSNISSPYQWAFYLMEYYKSYVIYDHKNEIYFYYNYNFNFLFIWYCCWLQFIFLYLFLFLYKSYFINYGLLFTLILFEGIGWNYIVGHFKRYLIGSVKVIKWRWEVGKHLWVIIFCGNYIMDKIKRIKYKWNRRYGPYGIYCFFLVFSW